MVRVVIVDDEEMIRGLLEQIVALLGWTSRSAATGIQGLQMVRQDVPDLVITDVGTPGISGIELLKAIKEDPDLSHIPVVVMSSMDGEEEARQGGCAACIAKPFSLESMLQTLTQIIAPGAQR